VPPAEKIQGAAGTMIVIDVATPVIIAYRRLRFGSERNWLAAIPSPSAMNRPNTAAIMTRRPWVIVASTNAILATSPSEAPKIVVVRVTESVSSIDFRFITVTTYSLQIFNFWGYHIGSSPRTNLTFPTIPFHASTFSFHGESNPRLSYYRADP